MGDFFDNTILCKNCREEMKKCRVDREGFMMRAVVCPRCNERFFHPADADDFEKFKSMRNKTFKVKLRLVGNSYAVSIPKEIVSMMREQEKIMDDMVKLCFHEFGKLSLDFGDENDRE